MILIFFDIEDEGFDDVPAMTKVLKVTGTEINRREAAANGKKVQA